MIVHINLTNIFRPPINNRRQVAGIMRSDTTAAIFAGKNYSSEEFAAWIEDCSVRGKSHICFVIGGSLGLHNSVCKRADLALSFSKMTFPHQLMRVILCEQIYRAFRIIQHEPYHK